MMTRCWAADPGARPSFTYLSQWLDGLLSERSTLNHIDLTQSLGHGLYSVNEDDNEDEDVVFGSKLNVPPTPAAKLSPLLRSVDGGRSDATRGDSRTDVSSSYTITLSDDSGYVGQQKVSVSSLESNVRASTVDSDSPTSLNSSVKVSGSPSVSCAEGYLDDVFIDEITQEKLTDQSPPLSIPWNANEKVIQSQPKGYESVISSLSRISSSSSPKSIKLSGSANSLINRQRRHSETDILSSLKRKHFSSSIRINNSKVFARAKPKFSPSRTLKRDVTGLYPTLAIENELYKLTGPRSTQRPPACVPVRRMTRYGESIMQSLTEADTGGSIREHEEKTRQGSSSDSLIEAAGVHTFLEMNNGDAAMPDDLIEGAGEFHTDLSVKKTSKYSEDKGRKEGADVLSMKGFSLSKSMLAHGIAPKENEDSEELKRFQLMPGRVLSSHIERVDSPKDNFTALSSSGEKRAEVYNHDSSKVTFMLHENHGTDCCNYSDGECTPPFSSGSQTFGPWETNERDNVTRTPSGEDTGYSTKAMTPRRRSSDPQHSVTSETSLQYSGTSSALLIGADCGDGSQQGSSTALQNSATCFWWPTPRKRRMGTADEIEPDQLQLWRQAYPNEKHPSALFVVADQPGKGRVLMSHLDV